MMMIDKGIKKNLRMNTSERGRTARKIYLKLKFIRMLTFFGLVILTFLEKPEWCMLNVTITESSDC